VSNSKLAFDAFEFFFRRFPRFILRHFEHFFKFGKRLAI